jgi:chromosome segregation ATPase
LELQFDNDKPKQQLDSDQSKQQLAFDKSKKEQLEFENQSLKQKLVKAIAIKSRLQRRNEELASERAERAAAESRISELESEVYELRCALKVQDSNTADEITVLNARLAKARENTKKAKAVATSAVEASAKMQAKLEGLKENQEGRIMELEQELAELRAAEASLQERHRAALRLIGEIWTRNQTLVGKSGHTR